VASPAIAGGPYLALRESFQSSPACGGLGARTAGLTFLPPPPGLQPGVRHLGGRGCGLSATRVPVFASFALAPSSRPIFALAEIVPVISMMLAAPTPHNFKRKFMVLSPV
jgi:hypothetical protein